MPIPAFRAGYDFPAAVEGKQWSDWTPFTYPSTSPASRRSRYPAASPAAGLPIGLQIVGPLYGDRAVLNAARAFEQSHPFQRPPL